VDFSLDGKYIATGDVDGDVSFWEVGDDEPIDYVNLGGEVQGVAFSPDNRYLAAEGNDGNVIVWLLDVATRTTVRGTYVDDDADNINSIAYSPDGNYVAVAVDLQWAYLWDLNSGERLGWGQTDASEVYEVAFSPDNRYLATGNDNGDLTLWELNSWWTDDVNTIDFKPGGNVASVAFSPDGNYLAADGYDGTNTYVNIYDVGTGRVAWQINSGNVFATAFSPNGEYIAFGDIDGVITFYRIGTNPTHVAEIMASDTVYDLAWSPDSTMISDGKDVWNVNTPSAPIAETTGNKIYWVDFSDGKIFRSNLDGSAVEAVLSGLSSPTGIAVDATAGKLYWTDDGTNKIQSANLNGSNVQELIYIKDVRSPTNIALDVEGGKMYWIQTFVFSSEIWRANLNGSNPQRILRTSLDSLNSIALDAAGGKIYWSQTGFLASNKIRRANLDGSNVQTLVSGWGIPSGIVLDIAGGKMYWTDSREHKIQRANLDGSNVQTLVTSGLDTPSDIALDVAAGKMYWVERRGGKIRRANLDGSNVQTLVSGLSRPSGIALDSTVEVMPAAPSNATALDSPNIVFESQTVYDSGPLVGWSRGNSNSVAEVGERIELKVLLKNSGATTAENVKGVLTTRDTSVRILDSSVDYGDILAGFTSPPLLPTIDLSEQTFKIEVPDTATPHDVTLTLYVTADNAGPWTLPIILSLVDQSEIQLALPDDFISEEAFGPHTTYFTLKVQYPTLTDIPDAAVSYGSCNIILRIPEQTQAFIFPIQTQGEKTQSIVEDILISVIKLTPGISTISDGITAAFKALDLILFFAEVIESIGLSEYDLKIALPTPLGVGRGHPDTTIDYVVLLKNEVASLRSIDITIEQAYRIGESSDSFEVDRKFTWNFGEGLAAPTTQPIALSEYPAFQLLPLEVQGYLLRHFSVFTNFEALRAPKETSLLPNYPNPFNPETWIPYQLATPTDVSISIYAADGTLVRTLDIGHQSGGIYQSKNRAAYWDGKNALGEPVASGVYFYTFTAGDFTQTRRMLILK